MFSSRSNSPASEPRQYGTRQVQTASVDLTPKLTQAPVGKAVWRLKVTAPRDALRIGDDGRVLGQ